ncbi:Uncharacterised protein [Mycobacteroides abscessus subsp. abscessus]|nr:Uncharacterised protein [Mycobacteroides abscessus subsp. abscessus]
MHALQQRRAVECAIAPFGEHPVTRARSDGIDDLTVLLVNAHPRAPKILEQAPLFLGHAAGLRCVGDRDTRRHAAITDGGDVTHQCLTQGNRKWLQKIALHIVNEQHGAVGVDPPGCRVGRQQVDCRQVVFGDHGNAASGGGHCSDS